jgi:hypothetical protein
MNHAAPMRVRNGVRNATHDDRDLARPRVGSREMFVKPLALDKLHREPRLTTTRKPAFVERHDARMTKRRHDLDLALKPHALRWRRETPAQEHLHRAPTAGGDLFCSKDGALPASVEFVAQAIAGNHPILRNCGVARLRLGHAHSDGEFLQDSMLSMESIHSVEA